MIVFTSDPNCITNIIYDSVVSEGSEILTRPFLDDFVVDPEEFLDGCIQFFSDLDSEDGYKKCADLLKLKQKLLTETK